MIGFVLIITGILCVLWGAGGVMGGIATAGSLWLVRKSSINLKQVFLGWVVAMAIGAIVFYISFTVLTQIMYLILPGQFAWGWSVVPEVLAYCLAGAVIGATGAYSMFARDEQTGHNLSEK